MALRRFCGADRILAAHSSALPQPDQLCGPFCASVALTRILDDAVPSTTALAVASGSAVWPHDIPGARPPGVPVGHEGWDELPSAGRPDDAGTNAAGLAAGIEAASGGRTSVVPVASPSALDLRRLLEHLRGSTLHYALLANVRTGLIVESDWDVGHFVILWGFDDRTGDVAVADTYEELGEAGMPAGCRLVSSDALADAMADAMAADGGRGVLLLVPRGMHGAADELVGELGLRSALWPA